MYICHVYLQDIKSGKNGHRDDATNYYYYLDNAEALSNSNSIYVSKVYHSKYSDGASKREPYVAPFEYTDNDANTLHTNGW